MRANGGALFAQKAALLATFYALVTEKITLTSY
jgi:hypothetical protein